MTAHRKPAIEPAPLRPPPHRPLARDVAAMLETVGATSLGELMAQTLPSSIRQNAPLDLGTPLSETEALSHMRELASQNRVFHLTDRPGLFGHDPAGGDPAQHPWRIPAGTRPIRRNQPEISQGRLKPCSIPGSMICDVRGPGADVATALLLDEATAAAEAMALAERAAPSKNKIRFSSMPRCIRRRSPCCGTRAEPLGWNLIVGDPLTDLEKAEVFGGLAAISRYFRRGARPAPGDRLTPRQGCAGDRPPRTFWR